MKKAFIAILVLLLLLVTGLLINTSLFKSKQIVSANGKPKLLPINQLAVKHLSQAIQIKTISYDNDTSSSTQSTFDSLTSFLKYTYPTVFDKLQDTLINNRSHLLIWKGKNSSAKPIILYAHLDVVPIEENTKDKWTHNPFSGAIADGFIWGRGTLDDKGSAIAYFEAITNLLAKNFTPERTTYFAFGADEEVGGVNGAAAIANYLRKQNIKFEFYIDEGGLVAEGIVPNIKRPVALIGTAEKGYVTFDLSVNIKGGHSSQPAKESAVDVLVNALKKVHDNPDKGRTVQTVEEFLDYVGPEMPVPLKVVFANRWLFKPIVLNEYDKLASGAALIRTTSATTVINAGIKENVIPSLVNAKINFRILNDETVKDVKERIIKIIDDKRVQITTGETTEPSKLSTASSYGFQLLQKTSADVFPDAIVAPYLMLGSTDSKHFQDITQNIYRFFPVRLNSERLATIHGINERIGLSDYMETISFYEKLLTNLK